MCTNYYYVSYRSCLTGCNCLNSLHILFIVRVLFSSFRFRKIEPNLCNYPGRCVLCARICPIIKKTSTNVVYVQMYTQPQTNQSSNEKKQKFKKSEHECEKNAVMCVAATVDLFIIIVFVRIAVYYNL